jgi:1-pyrroline-5-carboxylate dehydrogenase
VFVHPSADLDAVAVACVRGAYEFQGQKCSAASRLYVPASMWPKLKERMVALIGELRVGDVADFRNFMGAVIDARAFAKIAGYVDLARNDAACRVLAGGTGDDRTGWFIPPTLVETSDPQHRLMREEIFGPVLTAWAYPDAEYERALSICESTSPYALTGAFFARDRLAIEHAANTLRFAAGNFYVNDKPTGAVVGQQPFGGARASGTNDKAGSVLNLWRWVSPRAIKETFAPPSSVAYPFMAEK